VPPQGDGHPRAALDEPEHVDGREGDAAADAVGAGLDLERVALAGAGEVGDVHVDADAGAVAAVVRRDGQAAGPVDQRGQRAAVRGAGGVEVRGPQRQPDDDAAGAGVGDGGGRGQEEGVDGGAGHVGGDEVADVGFGGGVAGREGRRGRHGGGGGEIKLGCCVELRRRKIRVEWEARAPPQARPSPDSIDPDPYQLACFQDMQAASMEPGTEPNLGRSGLHVSVV
jgi:hypothetical protein